MWVFSKRQKVNYNSRVSRVASAHGNILFMSLSLTIRMALSLSALSKLILDRASASIRSLPALCLMSISMSNFADVSHSSLKQAARIWSLVRPDRRT